MVGTAAYIGTVQGIVICRGGGRGEWLEDVMRKQQLLPHTKVYPMSQGDVRFMKKYFQTS